VFRDLGDLLRGGSFVRTATAVALGFALVDLLHSIVTSFVISPLRTPYHDESGDVLDLLGTTLPLQAKIGGRVVPYEDPLNWGLTLLLAVLVVWGLAKLMWHDNRECPHCFSTIPLAAHVCPACTRDVPDE
jgi:hypothetical protein